MINQRGEKSVFSWHTLVPHFGSRDLVQVHWGCDNLWGDWPPKQSQAWQCIRGRRLGLFKELDTLIKLLYVVTYMRVNNHSSSYNIKKQWTSMKRTLTLSLHLRLFDLPAVKPAWNQRKLSSGHFHPKFLPTVNPGELRRLFPASPNPHSWQT